jgi:hypothetical protein
MGKRKRNHVSNLLESLHYGEDYTQRMDELLPLELRQYHDHAAGCGDHGSHEEWPELIGL